MEAYIEKERDDVMKAFDAFKKAWEPIDMDLYNLSEQYDGEALDEATDPAGFVDFFAS